MKSLPPLRRPSTCEPASSTLSPNKVGTLEISLNVPKP